MNNICNDIWVFVETDGYGHAKEASLELLDPAAEIARRQKGKLVAVIISNSGEQAAKEAITYGADSAIIVDGDEYEPYSTDAFAHAFCTLAKKYGPRSVVFSGTTNGRDLAPRIACRLQTGLTADCTQLGFNEEKDCVEWIGPAFGGSMISKILCPSHSPEMGTVRPGIFVIPEPDETRQGEILKESISFDAGQIRTEIIREIPDLGDVDITKAEIVVAGGRGAGEEGFKLLCRLAELLGASVGGSRIATDNGWLPESRQIGQTGKIIRPKIYIACGISGAIQHLIGVSGDAKIIAINTDPDAPIMKAADCAIVGDLFEIIPELISRVEGKHL